MLSPQEALVYTMVVAAESDHEVAEAEIKIIGDLVNHLPIFRGLDRAAMTRMATACSKMLGQSGGADKVFELIRQALTPPLRDTAYALACDVIAVDSRLNRNEMRDPGTGPHRARGRPGHGARHRAGRGGSLSGCLTRPPAAGSKIQGAADAATP